MRFENIIYFYQNSFTMKKLFYSFLSLVLILSSNFSKAQVTKMPLLEEFTSSTCPPCAANNPTFDAMCDDHEGEYVCVKYQMNWPGSGDIYYNNDGATRRTNYSVTGIPDLFVDGYEWATQPAGFTSTDLAAEKTTVTNLVIDAHYTLTGTTLTVYGNLLPQQDITGNCRRFIAIVERHTHNNTGSNGETEFSFVEQKMLPNGAGSYLTGLTSGASLPFTQTIDLTTVTNIEDMNNLGYAVWVQNTTSKEVLQATWATFPTGIQELKETASGIVALSPNPSVNQTSLEYLLQDNASVTLSVVNSIGQLVNEKNIGNVNFGLHSETIDTKNFAAGIYFVDLKIGGNHYRQKLVVE